MIKLSKPWIPEQAFDDVKAVLESGNLVQGVFVKRLEDEAAAYLGVRHAIAVSSATAALHLALMALEIGPGDEVIVPAFTFPATANVVEVMGASVRLVDIRPDDCCIHEELIEAHITPFTKAIMPVHEFGQSADIDTIAMIAERHNLNIIDDAACAFGAVYKGKKAGTTGLIGCYSLHPRKAITTGEGGFVVTNDDEHAEMLRSLRNHGIVTRDGKVDFLYAGLNYRMTDFQAAVGCSQLYAADSLNAYRRRIAAIYSEALMQNHVYQTYHIVLPHSVDRDALIVKLKENGIETNYGAYALNALTYYREKYGYKDSDCPGAYRAYKHGLALPMGNHISEDDARFVAAAVLKMIG
jgi:dTDP-4-amino-4,6-dideoxygalactose transaminase